MLKSLGARIETAQAPTEQALILVAPLGLDVTTVAAVERLDCTRTMGIDMLVLSASQTSADTPGLLQFSLVFRGPRQPQLPQQPQFRKGVGAVGGKLPVEPEADHCRQRERGGEGQPQQPAVDRGSYGHEQVVARLSGYRAARPRRPGWRAAGSWVAGH